jgi:hypothetical protein
MGLGPQLKATFSKTQHKAFDTVYYTVVRDAQPVVFTDWKTVKNR